MAAFTRLDSQALAMLAEDISGRISDSGDYPFLDFDSDDWARVLPAALTALGVTLHLDAPAKAPRAPRRPDQYPFLDKGDAGGQDDTDDVPAKAYAVAAARVDAYQRSHDMLYPMTPFDAGSNPSRQSIGTPGHCSVCAVLGHVVTHPERGCADVACDSDHTSHGQITRHTCTVDGKALPYGRKAPIGECLRCDQLRAGAVAREAHPAIQAGNRRREQEIRDDADRRHHFASGDHARNCGSISTCHDW